MRQRGATPVGPPPPPKPPLSGPLRAGTAASGLKPAVRVGGRVGGGAPDRQLAPARSAGRGIPPSSAGVGVGGGRAGGPPVRRMTLSLSPQDFGLPMSPSDASMEPWAAAGEEVKPTPLPRGPALDVNVHGAPTPRGVAAGGASVSSGGSAPTAWPASGDRAAGSRASAEDLYKDASRLLSGACGGGGMGGSCVVLQSPKFVARTICCSTVARAAEIAALHARAPAACAPCAVSLCGHRR
jgi:hypothetical protein